MDHAITRRRKGRRFEYVSPSGRVITSQKEIARIDKLGIPPAYRDVRISPDPRARVQAKAVDAQGRQQWRYHPDHVRRAAASKFQRMADFGRSLPDIRLHVKKLLKSRDPKRVSMGAAISMLDRCHFRPGSEYYKRHNESIGATTIDRRHVRFSGGGSRANISFQGKAGVQQTCTLCGPDSRALRQAIDGAGLPTVLEVTHELDPFTSKDFRTWGANTQFVHHRLAGRSTRESLERTAASLGHTPAVCKKNYVCPSVYAYDFEELGAPRAGGVGKKGLTRSERALLSLLQER